MAVREPMDGLDGREDAAAQDEERGSMGILGLMGLLSTPLNKENNR